MDEHITAPDESRATTRPFVQRTSVGVVLVAAGAVLGAWAGGLFMAIVWGGFRLVAPDGRWRGPGWRNFVRVVIVLLVVVNAALLTLWSPAGAERSEADSEESPLFADMPTASFDVATGLDGGCAVSGSVATLGHTHSSAFDAMTTSYTELLGFNASSDENNLRSGQQMIRFGQGGGLLERLAVVAEEVRDGEALVVVITAELYPATTSGTAGAQRARAAPRQAPGKRGMSVPDQPMSVVSMHAIGPCPPGLGLDFWVNATRDPLSSPWSLTEMPIAIATSPYRD